MLRRPSCLKVSRERHVNVGVGYEDLKRFPENCEKRGAVKLYRSLGLRDGMIMKIFQMKLTHACANYCDLYNNCYSEHILRFALILEEIVHTERTFKKRK